MREYHVYANLGCTLVYDRRVGYASAVGVRPNKYRHPEWSLLVAGDAHGFLLQAETLAFLGESRNTRYFPVGVTTQLITEVQLTVSQ